MGIHLITTCRWDDLSPSDSQTAGLKVSAKNNSVCRGCQKQSCVFCLYVNTFLDLSPQSYLCLSRPCNTAMLFSVSPPHPGELCVSTVTYISNLKEEEGHYAVNYFTSLALRDAVMMLIPQIKVCGFYSPSPSLTRSHTPFINGLQPLAAVT